MYIHVNVMYIQFTCTRCDSNDDYNVVEGDVKRPYCTWDEVGIPRDGLGWMERPCTLEDRPAGTMYTLYMSYRIGGSGTPTEWACTLYMSYRIGGSAHQQSGCVLSEVHVCVWL